MSTCTNIDITQEKTNMLLQNISAMLYSNYSPYTIISYISSEINATEIDNNWCLVENVSSRLYKNTTFIPPSSFNYTNKNSIYSDITGYMPIFSVRVVDDTSTDINTDDNDDSNDSVSNGGGGGSCPGGRREGIKNCSGWNGERSADLSSRMSIGLNFLNDDMIKSTFNCLSVTFTTYSTHLNNLTTHLAQTEYADITKRIGASIDWIAKAWKSVRDLIDSLINGWLVYVETGAHMPKANQDAITIMMGFVTDIMKNAGQYIEQLGEFLFDLADKVWDLKEIAYTCEFLSSQIKEVFVMINHTNSRCSQISNNTSNCKNKSSMILNNRSNYCKLLADTTDIYAKSVENTITNQSNNFNIFSIPIQGIVAGETIS